MKLIKTINQATNNSNNDNNNNWTLNADDYFPSSSLSIPLPDKEY